MKAIWKFPLNITDAQTVEMPFGARVLSVQAQNDQPCLWALVETTNSPQGRSFLICGTGNPAEGATEAGFIGTVQTHGRFVWHIFEEFPDSAEAGQG